MDKLTTISASLFMAANVFAIVSLAMPDWIVTDVGGEFSERPRSSAAGNPPFSSTNCFPTLSFSQAKHDSD